VRCPLLRSFFAFNSSFPSENIAQKRIAEAALPCPVDCQITRNVGCEGFAKRVLHEKIKHTLLANFIRSIGLMGNYPGNGHLVANTIIK
jgi:hypothetical protein